MQIFPVIHPQSSWVLAWDLVVLVAVLFLQAEASMVIVYGEEAWAFEVEGVGFAVGLGAMEGVLMADFVVKFNRGFYKGGYY
jgi:hypothetical protein